MLTIITLCSTNFSGCYSGATREITPVTRDFSDHYTPPWLSLRIAATAHCAVASAFDSELHATALHIENIENFLLPGRILHGGICQTKICINDMRDVKRDI